MSDQSLVLFAPRRLSTSLKAAKSRPKALKHGMPRKFKDHRTHKARAYRERFEAVTEQYQPQTQLGIWLAALCADLMTDFEVVRHSKKRGAKSARRKLTGLIFGALREVRQVSQSAAEPDLAQLLSGGR